MTAKEGANVVENNGFYTVTFTDLTHDAMGVCKIDGFPVFVKDALKGEKALIRIVKVNKNFGFGRLVEIKEESPFRKVPICEHYAECGGCDIMHMAYEMQLAFKKHRVKETLRKIGHIQTKVDDTIGMNNPYYYRNKAVIPFGKSKGKIIAGLYKNRSHDIVDLKRCHIFPKVFSEIVRYLKTLFQTHNVSVYDEDKHEGTIQGVMLRQSQTYDEISLTFIVNDNRLPGKEQLVESIVERFPNVVSIVKNFSSSKKNIVLSSKSKTLYGHDALRDRMLGFEYKISHRSFYQVNPVQTEMLYKQALKMAKIKESDTVVDAYCGIGTLSLPIARKAQRVIGIESVKEAVKNAQTNAKENDVNNVEFIHGKAEEILLKLKNDSIDILFVDPPRKGCEKEFLQAVMAMKIPKIVYISCNVSTLSRDANVLNTAGYAAQHVVPYDMFPQTTHIESVMLLEIESK